MKQQPCMISMLATQMQQWQGHKHEHQKCSTQTGSKLLKEHPVSSQAVAKELHSYAASHPVHYCRAVFSGAPVYSSSLLTTSAACPGNTTGSSHNCTTPPSLQLATFVGTRLVCNRNLPRHTKFIKIPYQFSHFARLISISFLLWYCDMLILQLHRHVQVINVNSVHDIRCYKTFHGWTLHHSCNHFLSTQ